MNRAYTAISLQKKTALTQEHRIERLNFAIDNQDLPEDHWNLTVFGDEKTFRSDVDGRIILWRPEGTR